MATATAYGADCCMTCSSSGPRGRSRIIPGSKMKGASLENAGLAPLEQVLRIPCMPGRLEHRPPRESSGRQAAMTQNSVAREPPQMPSATPGDCGNMRPHRIVSRFGVISGAGALLAVAFFLGLGKVCGDLAVACLLAGATRDLRRQLIVTASLALAVCGVPAVRLAVGLRYLLPSLFLSMALPRTRGRRAGEGFEAGMIGFAAAWIAAPFLGAPQLGRMAAGCSRSPAGYSRFPGSPSPP